MVKVCYNDDVSDQHMKIYPSSEYTPEFVSTNVFPTSQFSFEEFQLISSCSLQDIRDCMSTGNDSVTIGSYDSSTWKMYCKNKVLQLYICVDSRGTGCTFNIFVECDERVMKEFDELIKIAKCIENKTRYLS
jgi:hypothetical protein